MPTKATHNKPRTPGKGWRFLKEGEVIRDGDEFGGGEAGDEWRATAFAGRLVQNANTYRRNLETNKCPCSKPSSTCSRQSASSQSLRASSSCSGRCGCQAAKAGAKKCRRGGDTVKAEAKGVRANKGGRK